MTTGGVVRIWEGRVPRDKADDYIGLMHSVALPDYRAIPGNRGAYVLRRDDEAVTRVTMLTFWESLDAIRAFAGEPVERAKYYDFDREFLLAFPETAVHYEIQSTRAELPGGRLIGAACDLGEDQLRERLAEWRDLRERATAMATISGGMQLAFSAEEPVAPIADLVARESECCAFYVFDLRIDGPERTLEIRTPPGGEPAVRALLGLASA